MGAAGGLEWARLTRFWPGGVSMWARGGVSHHARSWHLPLFPSPQPHAPFALLCAGHGVRPGEALPVARAAAARAMAALRGGRPVMVSCSGGRSPLTFEVARGWSACARSVACAEGGHGCCWLVLGVPVGLDVPYCMCESGSHMLARVHLAHSPGPRPHAPLALLCAGGAKVSC